MFITIFDACLIMTEPTNKKMLDPIILIIIALHSFISTFKSVFCYMYCIIIFIMKNIMSLCHVDKGDNVTNILYPYLNSHCLMNKKH